MKYLLTGLALWVLQVSSLLCDTTNGYATLSGMLSNPRGLTLDAMGNILIANNGDNTFRTLTSNGAISSKLQVTSFDNTAINGNVFEPLSIQVDPLTGNYIVTDRFRIMSISQTGLLHVIAGQKGVFGYADGIGKSATFNYPSDFAIDSSGNFYIADSNNNVIRYVIRSSGLVTTFAGSASSPGYADGYGALASFLNPTSLVFDNDGNLFVSDYMNNNIRKIITSTKRVTTFCGSNVGYKSYKYDNISYGFQDGSSTHATLLNPSGLAIDNTGARLFAVCAGTNTIRKIDTATGSVLTIPTAGVSGVKARFSSIIVNFNYDGLLISDSSNNVIRKISCGQ